MGGARKWKLRHLSQFIGVDCRATSYGLRSKTPCKVSMSMGTEKCS
jgi:hypothetical protein